MKNLSTPPHTVDNPQARGQTFTISAQTNAKYYQSYSISFLDPWFGGKRPNSLQVSAYYSRQTGVNSSISTTTGAAPTCPSLRYNYGYNSNYYNYSYQNAYDPNKVLQMAAIAVGTGKRLSWPDDYFQFNATLQYQWYYLKNWEYLYYMNNGHLQLPHPQPRPLPLIN